ncbi:MAG: hypothetical protein HQL66_01340 [Magnetococcales bacterium]|nr:hypothetical protein [Magnetococcales bacterium]
MKSNAIGLVSVVILGVSLSGVGVYQGYKVAIGGGSAGIGKGARAISQSDDEKGEIRIPPLDPVLKSKIDQVRPKLNQLHHPKQVVAGNLSMPLMGFSTQALEQSERILSQSYEDYRERIISMAYVSGENRFAVIDGRLYREGDDFGESGAKIKTIHPDKVLIAGRDVRQWLDVHNPVMTSKAAPVVQAAAKPAAPAQEAASAPKDKPKGGAIEEGLQALKGYSDMMKALQGQQ